LAFILHSIDVVAPDLQALDFAHIIQIFPPFGLGNVNMPFVSFNQEVGEEFMDIAILALIFDLKAKRLIIFGERNNISAIFQKGSKFQFKLAVADDFIEYTLLRNQIGLIIRYQRFDFAQRNVIFNLRRTFISPYSKHTYNHCRVLCKKVKN